MTLKELQAMVVTLSEQSHKLKEETRSLMLSVLTAKSRKHIAPSNFALPKTKQYPIHDLAHAKNALARASGKPEESKVRKAVHKKYPQLKKKKPA